MRCFIDDMGLVIVDLNNVRLDDDDTQTFIHVTLMAWCTTTLGKTFVEFFTFS